MSDNSGEVTAAWAWSYTRPPPLSSANNCLFRNPEFGGVVLTVRQTQVYNTTNNLVGRDQALHCKDFLRQSRLNLML